MPVCSTCGTHYGATVRICVRDGTPLIAGRPDDPYVGKLLDDKYRIDAFISGGGMGAVYRAQHVMLGKTVAVKVIKDELVTSDEVVLRFQREARAASNLDHPNIVNVYDLGQTSEGTLYIAMEFIDGPSLRDAIRQIGPFPPARAVDILRQVASALSAAHRRQIVHRDLKSHNLMLASDDRGRDVVKLVDFGIAKTFDEAATQLTAVGYMLGTPHYMSPEQAAGQEVDHRADIYSLGVILYEMLTGAVPFKDESLTSVLVKLATEVPPAPSLCRPDLKIPAALEAIAMRCLAKNPADRFQSADEFADALDRAGTALAAPPVMPPALAAATLVRPAGVPPLPAGAAGVKRPAAAMVPEGDIPAARARSGFSLPALLNGRYAAIAVAVAAVLAVAIASGIALSEDPADRPPATPSTPAATNTASPVTPPASSTVQTSPAAAAGALTTSSSTQPPSATGGSVTGVASGGTQTPPRTTQQTTPRPSQQTPAAVVSSEPAASAPTQAAAVEPSVFVACKGFPDVCSAIRAEMARAFQRDGLIVAADRSPADVGVTASVTLVSEVGSADFGTPMLTRTYSVELLGDARAGVVAMPDPRRFSFDPRFGGERLNENARLIAADAVTAVRAFLTRTRP
jgi:serine/threonine-protein kinase